MDLRMKRMISFFCLAAIMTAGYAQDPRELLYNFEILNPDHVSKPKIDGFARERIEDRLDRGLVAMANGDNGVYLSWRLLKTDPSDIAFDVYKGTGNRSVKLSKNRSQPLLILWISVNRKPVSNTGSYRL